MTPNDPPTPKSGPPTPGKNAAPGFDRRSGLDRRVEDKGPPGKSDRRRLIEPRKPEVVELQLTDSDWAALTRSPPAPPLG
jgi:hypothetical protein